MTQTGETSASSAAKPVEAYGNRSVNGLAWLTLRTVGSKGVSFAGQIVLAYLLSPKDFGLIGLAYTVSAIVGMLNSFGIEQVLVHRHKRFDRWANSAFWMSMVLGLLAAAVIVVSAPLAARMYGEPRLIGLLLVLAVAAPLGNLIIVPKAKVQAQLRFRFMAVTGFIQAFLSMGLTVLFAAFGFHAYSFVLPTPIMALLMAGWYWRAAPSRISRKMEWRRWRFLFGDSVLLFLAGLGSVAVSQGDYFMLGLFYTAEVVGIYYFAFNLSAQVIVLFTQNLANVLFPVLSKLNDDPQRQIAAFMRSARILALVATPLCLLQGALAEPIIHLLFDTRWHSSVSVVQLLSIAMALRVISWPASSMMLAQGRFKTRLYLSLFFVILFFPLVLIGAWIHGATGVAVGVLVYYLIGVPVNLHTALWPGRVKWMGVFLLYMPALLAGAVSVGLAYVACSWWKADVGGDILRLVLVSAISLPLYTVLMWKISPEAVQELWQRSKSMIVPVGRRLGYT